MSDTSEWRSGTEVYTPMGKGKIAWIRMGAPSYSQPETISVLLDTKREHYGYSGTVFNVREVYTGEWRKFVCLRSLSTGERFFSNNVEGNDPRRLDSGEIVYQIMGYCNSMVEAQANLYK